MTKEKPFHEMVADKLLAQLEAGTAMFQKLNPDQPIIAFIKPFNPHTNREYNGNNALWLAMQQYNDPRWLTMRQANIIEAKVPKGSKATLISFMKEVDGVSTPQKAWVFNAQQLSNMPSLAESLERLQEHKAALAQQKEAPIEEAPQVLVAGEEVGYNNTTYKIVDVLKRGQVKIEDLATGEKTKISVEDGLYKSLLQAKYQPNLSLGQQNAQGQENHVAVGPDQDNTQDQSQRTGLRR